MMNGTHSYVVWGIRLTLQITYVQHFFVPVSTLSLQHTWEVARCQHLWQGDLTTFLGKVDLIHPVPLLPAGLSQSTSCLSYNYSAVLGNGGGIK